MKSSEQWDYYHYDAPQSIVQFKESGNQVTFSDDYFSGGSGTSWQDNAYFIVMKGYQLQMISESSDFQLKKKMKLNIPYLSYYIGRHFGYDLKNEASNGSTIEMTVTDLTDSSYNASFEGKVWSAINPDTLFITEGQLINMALPQKL